MTAKRPGAHPLPVLTAEIGRLTGLVSVLEEQKMDMATQLHTVSLRNERLEGQLAWLRSQLQEARDLVSSLREQVLSLGAAPKYGARTRRGGGGGGGGKSRRS